MSESKVWKYYVPNDGENADDATKINKPVFNEYDAATIAANEIWYNRDGWECGIDLTDQVVIIDPNGAETHWNTSYSISVNCFATEMGK
jgi:hypothetical protein